MLVKIDRLHKIWYNFGLVRRREKLYYVWRIKKRIAISNTNTNDTNDTNNHEDSIGYRNTVHKVFSEYSLNLVISTHEKIIELYNENKTKSEKEKKSLLNLMEALERDIIEKINVKSQSKDDREVEWT